MILTELLQKRFFGWLKAEITGEPYTDVAKSLSAEELTEVFSLAAHHDISLMIADYLLRENVALPSDWQAQLQKLVYAGINRYARLQSTLKQTVGCLNAASIPYILLKGSVIRALYPQPWMRSSSDIDVLVPVDQCEQALQTLLAGGFSETHRTAHDIALKNADGSVVELHFSLLESDRVGDVDRPLQNVWDEAAAIGSGSAYAMSEALFYYYHLAHMAKHLEIGGGCGIRPFVDLWLLNQTPKPEGLDALLEEGHLTSFADHADALCRYWFENELPDDATEAFSELILSGGIWGTKENRVAVHKGNPSAYLKKRLWLPYAQMAEMYPTLKKYPDLLPIYELVRWFKALRPEKLRQNAREYKQTTAVVSAQEQRYIDLWESFGFAKK